MARHAIWLPIAACLLIPLTLTAVTSTALTTVKPKPTQSSVVAIATDWDQVGYLGGITTVKVWVSYAGAKVGISVQTRSDAHAAFAAAIFGMYDNIIHKFRAFGGGSGTNLKSGCTFAYWECYSVSLLWKSGTLSKNIGPGEWLHISYNAKAEIRVDHTWAWGLQHTVQNVLLTANPVAAIPPDAYVKHPAGGV